MTGLAESWEHGSKRKVFKRRNFPNLQDLYKYVCRAPLQEPPVNLVLFTPPVRGLRNTAFSTDSNKVLLELITWVGMRGARDTPKWKK